MRYITVSEALYVHQHLIERFGGQAGICDLGLIETALLRPQTGYYSDTIEEAAALWESLTMNHGFIDGNKRVGFACMDLFLELNGYQLEAGRDAMGDFVLDLLEGGSFAKDALDQWLRQHVVKAD